MPIDDVELIDLIGIDNETDKVILTISDHLDWKNEFLHLKLLQAKLNAYLKFIESGEIYESYLKAKNKAIVIQIVKKYSLTRKGEDFFRTTGEIVKNAGFELKSIYLENQ
jgi:hypothetical protein